ncbi:MAG: hypothetical protein KAR20_02755 [Candidatus Heimdallarchaeota archaeon]|nr:hypothetical protein [Candidatus Heimdallarchaeota archaeon]
MVIQWIILGVFALVLFALLKMDHHVRVVKIAAIAIIGILIYFSMMGIFSSEQVDVTSPRGIVQATYLYFGWIGETTGKLFDIGKDTVNLVGNAIKINNSDEDKLKR